MTYTLLFNLDETLLNSDIESFLPVYLQALSEHGASYVSPEILLPALLSAMQRILDSEDPSRTLQEVFENDFYSRIGITRLNRKEILEEFYDNFLSDLSIPTELNPDAVSLINWAISLGYRIAIASDPLLPRTITYHRLRGAGFEPEQFELVSSFENFHFSKIHAAYYAELLGQLGWPDGPVLMIGNDMQRDIIPANRLGLKTYYIDDKPVSNPGPETGRGNLADLRPWLESQNPSALQPSLKSPDAITAIMRSTPAVLQNLTVTLTDQQWKREPASDDWAINEIVCHLRDTDIEIHRVQLKLMIEKVGAFIPRPDSSIWANERNYLNVNGYAALSEFTDARLQNIEHIRSLDASIWSRRARHAIFGPTSFAEVLGFMADHDRAHIQQVWKTLNAIHAERV